VINVNGDPNDVDSFTEKVDGVLLEHYDSPILDLEVQKEAVEETNVELGKFLGLWARKGTALVVGTRTDKKNRKRN
jgi:hypothetical protein